MDEREPLVVGMRGGLGKWPLHARTLSDAHVKHRRATCRRTGSLRMHRRSCARSRASVERVEEPCARHQLVQRLRRGALVDAELGEAAGNASCSSMRAFSRNIRVARGRYGRWPGSAPSTAPAVEVESRLRDPLGGATISRLTHRRGDAAALDDRAQVALQDGISAASGGGRLEVRLQEPSICCFDSAPMALDRLAFLEHDERGDAATARRRSHCSRRR